MDVCRQQQFSVATGKRSWGLEKQGYYGKVYILPSDKVMSHVHKDWKKAPDVSRKRKKFYLFTG